MTLVMKSGNNHCSWEWFSDRGSEIGKPQQLVEAVYLLISLELQDELLKTFEKPTLEGQPRGWTR